MSAKDDFYFVVHPAQIKNFMKELGYTDKEKFMHDYRVIESKLIPVPSSEASHE